MLLCLVSGLAELLAADGAAPKGKRSRGGSRKPAVKFEPGESLCVFACWKLN